MDAIYPMNHECFGMCTLKAAVKYYQRTTDRRFMEPIINRTVGLNANLIDFDGR